MLNVVVPPGVAPGDTLEFADPSGAMLTCVVPHGCSEGMTFEVEVNGGWLEEILNALTQNNFVNVLDGFCTRECPKFLAPGQEGHSLEQTSVHSQYVRFYESRIESYLRQHGVSQEEFMAALLEADAAGRSSKSTLVSSLLLVQDFESFAKMMTQRALELPG